MRVLFVTPYVPSPIRVRPYHFLRELERRHDVVVLTIWQSEQERRDLLALKSLVPTIGVHLGRLRALANCLRALSSGVAMQAAYSQSPDLARLLRSVAVESAPHSAVSDALNGPFDVVHVEHLLAAHAREYLPTRTPTLFDSVDCISLLLERTLRSSHSARQRLLARVELRRTRSYEAGLLARFDRVTATAPEDADALRALAPRADVVVVPNGVDCAYFRPLAAAREPATLVFSGKMSYHANATAILYFVDQILPLIRRTRPDVRLSIVGSSPSGSIQSLTRDPAITVTGYVPDLRDFLGRAAIAICPVTIKVGIQNKVLEAMAMGVPVVATTAGAAGLTAQAGRDLLVATGPAEFADHVCALLADRDRAERVGQAGRAYVQAQHQWEAAAHQLETLYVEAVEHRAALVAGRR